MPKTLTIHAEDGHPFSAYLCEATKKGKGCILILHEIFGLTKFTKELCQFWAQKGYHALAPALYDRLEPNIVISYNDEGCKKASATKQRLLTLHHATGGSGYALPLLDVNAAKDYLSTTYSLPVAILGLSFGGTLAWLAASALSQIAAVSAYYGTHIHQFIDDAPLCPVMLHCAKYDDLFTPDQVQVISLRYPEIEVYLYPATHGFRCSYTESFTGQCFDADATHAADERTEWFFDHHC